MINQDFKSIRELVKAFPDEQTCINHLELLRWNGNVVSPFDASSKVYKCAGNKYKCKNTGKYFNVRTQTLFDNTKVELQTWFIAIYLITGHKKGISSLQLGRDLNVTQKTAWFMLHRIRACYGLSESADNGELMGGGGTIVEVDETIVGGKVSNMTNKKRKELTKERSQFGDNKTIVQGAIERGGKLRLTIIDKNRLSSPQAVAATVDFDSVLMTDKSGSYTGVGKNYLAHEVVDHDVKEYSREGYAHTNTLEGAFSLFDRMIIGTYHYASPKHMQAYLDEHAFRYNSRKMSDCSRFNFMLLHAGTRLTYQNLIAE